MNRKSIPLVLMLLAGVVTCIITFVRKYSVIDKLAALLAVLVIFLILGNILRFTLDYFDRENEKRALEEGEVIEKENESEQKTEGGAQEE